MRPFLRGPRQTTASFGSVSMNPIDMTPRLSDTYTGDQPVLLWCTSSPSSPSMRGALGPQMSMSSRPTCATAAAAELVSSARAAGWRKLSAPGCPRRPTHTPAAQTPCFCRRHPCQKAPATARTCRRVKAASVRGGEEADTEARSCRTLCLMWRMRSTIAATSGSGPLGACAHAACGRQPRKARCAAAAAAAAATTRAWLGQPAHAAACPAVSELVPGQF